MDYRAIIYNPTTRERREARVTGSDVAPVVIVNGERVEAGMDGFTALAVDVPAIHHEDATVGTHPDAYTILDTLHKRFGAPDNDLRWTHYTYPDED